MRLGNPILGPGGRLILPRGTQALSEADRFLEAVSGAWTIRIEDMQVPGILAPQAVAVIERVAQKGVER